MDPFSHAVVGGVAAVGLCRQASMIRRAAVCGALAGMAPDLDIFIRVADNPMLGLGFHRHFTHALVVAPLGALVVAALLRRVLYREQAFRLIYLFCLAGFLMHGVLDALTNYGTHLFWPFTNRRESWSIISIVDPIFTLTLLMLLIVAAVKKARRVAWLAAAFALTYWSIGYMQRENATSAMRDLAATRQNTVERFEVKPSLGNLLLWRMQYQYKGRIYIDAIHISPWRGQHLYEGGSLPLYVPKKLKSEVQQRDLEFFNFFSDGWLAKAPNNPEIIGDVRFAMLPNQLTPLWGIRLQPERPEAHVAFKNMRERSAGDVQQLWDMILGRPLPKP